VEGVEVPSALNALCVGRDRAGWVSVSIVAGMPRIANHNLNKVLRWNIYIACSPLVDLISNTVGINSTVRESQVGAESNGNTESCKLHDEIHGMIILSYDFQHNDTFIRFE